MYEGVDDDARDEDALVSYRVTIVRGTPALRGTLCSIRARRDGSASMLLVAPPGCRQHEV